MCLIHKNNFQNVLKTLTKIRELTDVQGGTDEWTGKPKIKTLFNFVEKCKNKYVQMIFKGK